MSQTQIRGASRTRSSAADELDSGSSRAATLLRPGSPVPVYIGVGLCVAGFALLAYTWGRVADEVQVFRQIPYLVSGGFTGLALVLVGVTVVNIAAKRADAAERLRQHEQLAGALQDLRTTIDLGDE